MAKFIPSIIVLSTVVIISVADDTSTTEAPFPWIPIENKMERKRHEELLNQTRTYRKQIKGLFIGDQFMLNWLKTGRSIWEKHYASRNVFNYGVNGDGTGNVVWRIQNEEFLLLPNVKVIVLMVGLNNFNSVNNWIDPQHVGATVRMIMGMLRIDMPQAKQFVLSIIPCVHGDPVKFQLVSQTNHMLHYGPSPHNYTYIDLNKYFVKAFIEELKEELFDEDQNNLSEKGYQVWYEAMEPILSKILDPEP